nr:hypothetical protein [Providencia sneebia]
MQQNRSTIHDLPSLNSLEQEITQLNQQIAIPNQNQQQFIIHIQHVIDKSYVKLNRLQPSINSDTQEKIYTIEIQGTYPDIYKCIQAIILSSPNPKGLLSSANFQPQHGYLTATLTISFIKDDITHEK